MTLVLFDIDGTLLFSRGVGKRGMELAFAEVFGIEADFDGVTFAGRLDNLIWRDLCASHGVPDSEQSHARFRSTYARLLDEQLRVHADPERPYALPGVQQLLGALERQGRAALGVLSGNYAETGKLKIDAAGLDAARFQVGAWGGDGQHRRDLVPVALERYRTATGEGVAPGDVVVVGDTPHDVDCGRAHGCRVLAVTTGAFDRDELAACEPDLLVDDLSDTARIVSWIVDA